MTNVAIAKPRATRRTRAAALAGPFTESCDSVREQIEAATERFDAGIAVARRGVAALAA